MRGPATLGRVQSGVASDGSGGRRSEGRLGAPDLARPLNLLIDTMAGRRQCLVHGDFSPKNVLVGLPERRFWIIDFEVAHYGDPAFDIAFLLTHLLLKSLHRPADQAAYDRCVRAFLSAYTAAITSALEPDMGYVFRHVGGLLTARVIGKLPAEYLTAAANSAMPPRSSPKDDMNAGPP